MRKDQLLIFKISSLFTLRQNKLIHKKKAESYHFFRSDKLKYTALFVFSLFELSVAFGQAPDDKKAIKPAYQSGVYRNLFKEAGYAQKEIDQKVEKAYHDVFEGAHKVYFEVGDSLGYVCDVKNHDARTEGLSYGMMIAVQLNKKDVFDRIWRWSKKYLQHRDGPREGYFAWSISPQTRKRNSEGSASDGELYFITSLLFASNRWGNNTGIDYYKEARYILDAMWKKMGKLIFII
ncbi:glycosyl hydrolase family 8 [Mucilaginibacter sp. SG564]|uniref:glycosyl hydrolase family 8 n=1 Tax=Mucilaginibacter sp. SG564 TaxID=2587022 RepID=UPI001C12AD2C|nr:glycosyl hydrolase family 8 [Mucilaginibacter sp. SG564]NOW96404.1 hypothetical protein [Mucilaginibacter sp. SG564]